MPHGRSPRHERRRPSKSRQKPKAEPAPAAVETGGPVRIQRLLAAAGLASRRGAEIYLREGRVTVNGRVAGLGDSADPERDEIAVDGERIATRPLVYWVLHKPRGVLTTASDPEGRRTVLDLLPPEAKGVVPVGRLDRETSGLLLLTNDGTLANRLLHPSLGNEREYRVTVRGDIPEAKLARLGRGLILDDGPTGPADVGKTRYDRDTDTTRFQLTIRQGRKRQIRKSLAVLGHPVKRLVRTRFGPVRLGRLPVGSARRLDASEVRALRDHAAKLASVAGARPRHRRRRRAGAR